MTLEKIKLYLKEFALISITTWVYLIICIYVGDGIVHLPGTVFGITLVSIFMPSLLIIWGAAIPFTNIIFVLRRRNTFTFLRTFVYFILFWVFFSLLVKGVVFGYKTYEHIAVYDGQDGIQHIEKKVLSQNKGICILRSKKESAMFIPENESQFTGDGIPKLNIYYQNGECTRSIYAKEHGVITMGYKDGEWIVLPRDPDDDLF